jgi:predicted Zn-dependent protease
MGAVQSIGPLTDPSKINVQPARVRLVKIGKDMTIDAFNRENPSKIPFEYVAIINGVEPGALLKAGTLVKQVK